MSTSVSDKTKFSYSNYAKRSRQIPTGACVTPTKQSKPIYSNIKYLCSENGNKTYVIDTSEMTMHTGNSSSHKYSLDSSVEDPTELDRLIEFHAKVSQKDSFHFDSSAIPSDSSLISETFSNISWLDPKSSSEKLTLKEDVKNWSKCDTESDTIIHTSEVSVANDEIKINIYETPKRTYLKPFERGKKQKPLRLANLPRKIYTRDKKEVKITKEDVEIVEPTSDNEMFDIKKHLARVRRKLSFPLEDSFKTSSSSFTSSIPQEDSVKQFPISVTSTKIQEDSDDIEDSGKNTTGFIASREKQEDFNSKSLLHEVSDMEKRTVAKDTGYFLQKEESLEELSGKFLLEDYLAKLKGIAAKPPTTKRAKKFDKRTTSRTYFDFDDYCMKIFILKKKFIDKQNKNKTL